jgi:hypothetical protein
MENKFERRIQDVVDKIRDDLQQIAHEVQLLKCS